MDPLDPGAPLDSDHRLLFPAYQASRARVRMIVILTKCIKTHQISERKPFITIPAQQLFDARTLETLGAVTDFKEFV